MKNITNCNEKLERLKNRKLIRLLFCSIFKVPNHFLNLRIEKMKQDMGIKLQDIADYEQKNKQILEKLEAAQETHR